ncbi:MAG: CBS domain-containing protein, partial [Euryarchaeota archaeon]|nr:CBS domain-containing protein [Euryarchaeota archaeon]
MKIKEMMHKPTFVDPNAPIADAVKTMIEKNISSVIVGSNDKEIIGMFTERDVLREVVAKGL